MHVYTYSEARQKLAQLLTEAEREGRVLIHHQDGRTFALTPVPEQSSPLAVPPINAEVATADLVDLIRKGRLR